MLFLLLVFINVLSFFIFTLSNLNSGENDGPLSDHSIKTDQFGYKPDSVKIAVISAPKTGVFSPDDYVLSAELQVINENTGTAVFTGNIEQWQNGATDGQSGDAFWHFDFSSVNSFFEVR